MGEHGGKPLPGPPCAEGRIPYATEPKYIHTELGIGYRMLED